ncbi:interphotoreceptor matrix proteoglycan 1 isoform X4 [Ascaphus truei]|uniref:interphotoreceptor matrix proteoglycan 1 isoform X4 n=1 Tax=Ascaphus truei TaxID=8439 RepID=UPI003F59D6DB
MNCKGGLILLIICISIQHHESKETFSKSRQAEDPIPDTPQPDIFIKLSRLSTIRKLFDLKRHRAKRSSVFPTGVKVCPQESVKQIIASHQAYYKLRVCQEAVWEAFRIFLDRIPQTAEYQNWVEACQQETFCIFEIGKNFSSSQEHLDIIQQRVKEKKGIERKDEIAIEGSSSPVIVEESPASTIGLPHSYSTSPVVTSNDTLFNEIINDTKSSVKEMEVTNLVPEQPVQQIVEFTVTLTNQGFTAELSDPSSPQYQELATNFQLQMQKVFEKLPGFKEIQVLRFRQKKEKDGSDSIVVRYAVVFQRGSSESKNNVDETPTIASNKVENGNIQEAKEMSYTVIELQEMVAMALRDDRSLPMDLQTLWFTDDKPLGYLERDVQPLVNMSTSEMKTHLDEILSAEQPLDNPSPVTVKQGGEDLFHGFMASPAVPGKERINPQDFQDDILPNAINEFTMESTIGPLKKGHYSTISLPKESLTVLTTFQYQSSIVQQPLPIEKNVDSSHVKDIIDIVLDDEGFTVPFTTPHANGKVGNQDELKAASDKDVIRTASHLPFDTGIGNVPSSVEGDDFAMPISTILPHREPNPLPGLSEDEDKGSKHSNNITHTNTPQADSEIVKDQKVTEISGAVDYTLPSIVPGTKQAGADYIIVNTMNDSAVSRAFFHVTVGSNNEDTAVETKDEYWTSSYTFAVDKMIIPAIATASSPIENLPGEDEQNADQLETSDHLTSSHVTTVDKGKDLVVFFSLRLTNMPFSDDLFNRSSPEYKTLEQQLLHLLLPYLQSNLTGFKELEILNFRKGSVIVNSKLKFAKSVPYNITEAVHCVLEDFCNAAAQLLNLQIDSYSLDIEPAGQADPCKFMACDECSECSINSWTKEADCVCKPGYISVDGQPCQSVCDLEPNHCADGETCQIVAGEGAVCRCLKGKHWLYNGEHCSKTAVDTLSLIIIAASLGALFLVFILIKLVGRMYGGYNHEPKSEVNVNSYSLQSSGKITPAFYHDESMKRPYSPPCTPTTTTSACISPSRDTNHGRLHTPPQHTQLSVRRLPESLVKQSLRSDI